MTQLIKDFINDESGATLVEYAILIALISVAVIAIIATLGTLITQAFQDVVTALQASPGT